MAPPTRDKLIALDPAMIVPHIGPEVGYVASVTQQAVR